MDFRDSIHLLGYYLDCQGELFHKYGDTGPEQFETKKGGVMVNRSIRAAAVQMICKNGAKKENLANATAFVNEAAEKGAQLILLPEFMPSGYKYTTEIWDSAETKEGPTVWWLKETAKRLGVFLGTSFLEAEGEHFFNTFALAENNGQIAGWVRKATPAAFEAYFTEGEPQRCIN